MNAVSNKQTTEQATDELIFDDVSIDVPESGGAFETVPAGMYNARLIGFKETAKPDWRLKGEPDEDKYQWEWTFEISDGEYQGIHLVDWTTRKWHEKATAHKYAAALLGVPTLPVGVGMSTRQLAGKPCQVWVVEVASKKDATVMRNYVERVTPVPAPRMRPQRPQSTQTQAVPRVRLQGYPTDDGDQIPFEDGE